MSRNGMGGSRAPAQGSPKGSAKEQCSRTPHRCPLTVHSATHDTGRITREGRSVKPGRRPAPPVAENLRPRPRTLRRLRRRVPGLVPSGRRLPRGELAGHAPTRSVALSNPHGIALDRDRRTDAPALAPGGCEPDGHRKRFPRGGLVNPLPGPRRDSRDGRLPRSGDSSHTCPLTWISRTAPASHTRRREQRRNTARPRTRDLGRTRSGPGTLPRGPAGAARRGRRGGAGRGPGPRRGRDGECRGGVRGGRARRGRTRDRRCGRARGRGR